MPLSPKNSRTFHRCLYGGQQLETITLYHRNDDQQEGTVRAVKLFQCRRSSTQKLGEPLQNEMASHHFCIWHLPAVELLRVGIQHINVLDTIQDKHNRWWRPESNSRLTFDLWGNYVHIECLRCDPPNNQPADRRSED